MKKIFSAGTGLHANRSAAGTAVVFLILLFTSLLMMMPFVYSIVQSLKPMEELFAFPPKFFVQNPTTENYQKLFQLTENLWVPFSRYVFNSVFVSVAGTALYILVASMAAYSLAFGDFPGAKLFNEIVVQALLFSSSVLAVSQYVILAKGRMLNTYWAVILPALSAPLGLFLMRQFMEQMIPKSMLEAAQIDGAGTFTTFWRVVMPVVKPAWLTLIIFTFQSLWSGAGNKYIYREDLKVLPTVLSQISAGGMARAGVAAAAAVVLMIPPILVFMAAQRNVLETMATSGIKE
ncbi:carbohydrate ABC transporter permease [Candidatus Allofournierella merdipullorum]|uniref:carbohydrate ABC transporter permease n=1 Tax=Candidatus Allofournierella merdipullorum TaxID=2838595 RepID=UPI002A842E11|nr:carbohydrate ABC transporter permease [Candidatus Fournierella merdipullorum]